MTFLALGGSSRLPSGGEEKVLSLQVGRSILRWRVEENGSHRSNGRFLNQTRASERFREEYKLALPRRKKLLFYGFVGIRGVEDKRTPPPFIWDEVGSNEGVMTEQLPGTS